MKALEITVLGQHAIVTKSERWPKSYLWIDIGESRFFLGVLTPGMTKGEVRRMVFELLERQRLAQETSSRVRS